MFKDNQSQIHRTGKGHRAICLYRANAVIKVESSFIITNQIPKNSQNKVHNDIYI